MLIRIASSMKKTIDIEEKPKKRFFRKLENEDEDEEEEPQAKTVHTAPRKQPAPKTTASSQAAAARAPKPAAPVSPKVTPMRKKAGALNMEVCVIKPASMEIPVKSRIRFWPDVPLSLT